MVLAATVVVSTISNPARLVLADTVIFIAYPIKTPSSSVPSKKIARIVDVAGGTSSYVPCTTTDSPVGFKTISPPLVTGFIGF